MANNWARASSFTTLFGPVAGGLVFAGGIPIEQYRHPDWAVASGPGALASGSTTSVAAVNGVASFSNLTINKNGSGYTLRVSSSGLTAATSSSITVTKTGQTASTLFAPAGNPATDLSLAPLVLDSPDLWDVLGFKKHPRSI